ncbi:MAG TPA: alpha/beta hydrolase [Dermatophilaceae bacterium]
MEIDELEAISEGEVTQWVRIRSRDANNPVLLLIQQGPGLPMINEARAFERALSLEDDFTVVYWDQRGSGLSHRGQKSTAVDLALLVSDAIGLLEHLRERFGGPSLIAGFSIGGTIGVLAAAQRPDLVAAVVAVGMDINGPDADTHAYNFALETAVRRRHRRAERQLRKVGAPPHEKFEQFATRVRWATNFGGVHQRETYGSMVRGLLGSPLRSPDYTTADLVRTVAGITSTQTALLPELAHLDLGTLLPDIDTPVVLVQGRNDQVAPGHSAQHYFDMLQAPSKELVWFENSAHMPHLEEPQAFKELLHKVRRATLPGLESRTTHSATPIAGTVHNPIATTSTNRVEGASEE